MGDDVDDDSDSGVQPWWRQLWRELFDGETRQRRRRRKLVVEWALTIVALIVVCVVALPRSEMVFVIAFGLLLARVLTIIATLPDVIPGRIASAIPAAAAVLTFLLTAAFLNGREADPDFYAAAAQILPILFLGLIVEARLARRDPTPAGRSVLLFSAVVLVIAMAYALGALLTDEPSPSVYGYVVGGLFGGTVGVTLAALFDHSGDDD